MTNNEKIHIKIEVYKDKNTGDLRILTHFDKNSPNIFKDTQGYLWLPTIEEKELIDETFDLMQETQISSPIQEQKFQEENKTTAPPPLESSDTITEETIQTANYSSEDNSEEEHTTEEDIEEFEPQPPDEPDDSFNKDEIEKEPARPLEDQLNFTPTTLPPEKKDKIKSEEPSEPELSEHKVKVTTGKSETESIEDKPKPSSFSQNNVDKIADKKETVFEVTSTDKKTKKVESKQDFSKESQNIFNKKPDENTNINELEKKPFSDSKFNAEKVTKEESNSRDSDNKPFSDSKFNAEKVTKEEPTQEEQKNIPQEEGMIVRADADAIERALKKHSSDRDESIVEADEETIVNKVLSQKKWSKKKEKDEE